MSQHELSPNAAGEVVTTQEWAARRVAARTSVTVEQAREVLAAWYDLGWAVLLSGHRLRLGDVGTIAVCERRGTTARLVSIHDGEEFTTRTRPTIEVRGRLSAPFRDAWYEEGNAQEEEG